MKYRPEYLTLVSEFVRESNRIEGIDFVRAIEIDETMKFICLPLRPKPVALCNLAEMYTNGKGVLRDRPGMDVRVGNHIPPRGGPHILDQLGSLLLEINTLDMVEFHKQYETLHPFMDGNGRTGRALWAWQMVDRYGWNAGLGLGFLHRWYYQTLEASRK